MSHLAETILSSARALPEGGLLSPKEFLRLASRAAVDQTLTRLTRQGKLLRIARGAYALPVARRFGDRPPSTTAVVQSIESASGEVVVANGAAEANALGLSTQVPTREVFLTSGRARSILASGPSSSSMAANGSLCFESVRLEGRSAPCPGSGPSKRLRH